MIISSLPCLISKTLWAVVKESKGDGFVQFQDMPEPSPSEGEVLVKVGAAGICGSDLNIFHGSFPGYNVPVILGHEFSGLVEDIGSKVSSFALGDRVVCETHAYVCNDCNYCKSGSYNLCPKRKAFGYGVHGAFTKYVTVREAIVHNLPEKISIDEAAVLEPLSVVVNALTRNSNVRPDDSVVIFGPGPIGLLCLQLTKLAGASVTLVGTQHSRRRLDFASKVLSSNNIAEETDFLQTIENGEASEKFDLAIIATGNPDAFEPALKSVRKAGRVVQIGESTKRASFEMSLIEKKNLSIQGSFSHNWPIWEKAISLVNNGEVKLSPLITHRVDLADWQRGFDLAESREAIKVLIKP
jgi:L-iditol 2-dehydrogenase